MTWVTQFMDGFDHYATADIAAKWTVNSGCTIDSSIFRTSGKALKMGTSQTGYCFKSVGQARNFCIGFGFYIAATPPISLITDAGAAICGVCNNPSTVSDGQAGLAILSDGKLHAVRGNIAATQFLSGAVELGVGSTVLTPAAWHFIELRVFIDDTGGQFEVKLNGVTEINLTSVDTKLQTFDYASVFTFGGGNISNTISKYLDDVYIRTSSSSTAESGGFLGDIKVKPYYPNGDGTYTAMTCSTGSTHYTLVDEANPTTTDYVSSNTALQKDSYTFQDVSETGSIKAVQLSVYAAKDDAGFRGLDLFTKSGATEDFATSQTLSTTPLYKLKMWEKDPNTAADWSQANLNAAEFGQRISADI